MCVLFFFLEAAAEEEEEKVPAIIYISWGFFREMGHEIERESGGGRPREGSLGLLVVV